MSGAGKSVRLALLWVACLALPFAGVSFAQAQTARAPAAKPAAAVTSGYLKSMTGPVFIRRGGAGEVAAKPGDLLGPPVTIRAAAGGEAVLLFADGQSVTLGGDSVLRIDFYQFDTANVKASRASLLLEYGRMRVVTGAIHTDNPSALRIGAGNASVNILSKDVTAFVVEIARDEKDRGWAAATIGAISIRTPYGRIPEVAADQFASWQPRVAPLPPQPLAAAPAAYQAIVTASRATVEGSGAPIDVQSAAVQAALSVGQASAQGAPSNTTTMALSGQLNMVSGKVYISRESGVQAEARIGDSFGPGTTITTASGGEAGLLFSGGIYASLAGNSIFRIVGAQPAARDAGTTASALGLSIGRVSFVSWGAPIGDAGVLGIALGDAHISIVSKGMVAFVVEVDGKTPSSGSLAALAGEVSVQTPEGPARLVPADRFTAWGPGQPPDLRALAEAPAFLRQAFANTVVSAPSAAEVVAELASAAPTGAGPADAQPPQPQPPAQAAPAPPSLPPAVILPPVSSGGGGGCVGSPC